MGEARHALIFFVTTPDRPRGQLRPLRLVRRRPRLARLIFLAWLIRTLTRSNITHVAIGYDGAVLDPDQGGTRYWPTIRFAMEYPRIIGCYTVPVTRPIDLDRYQGRWPVPVLPSIVKYFTAGNVTTRDCSCTVADALRQGGVKVPKSAYSPVRLFRWLAQQGYDYERFDDTQAAG